MKKSGIILSIIFIFFVILFAIKSIPTNYKSQAASPCSAEIIPAYFSPSKTSLWTNALQANAVVKIMIINPDNGPGTVKDNGYITLISQAKTAGVTLVGYVATGYGNNSITSVESVIDTWHSLYGINDIFLDEVTTDTTHVSYYSTLYQYITNKTSGAKVIFNPGTVPDESYMAIGGIWSIFEDDYTKYLTYTPPTWVNNYPADRFYNIVYGVMSQNDMNAAYAASLNKHAGYVYITDDTLPNPYDTLPAYWQAEVNLLGQKCNNNSPTVTPQPTTTSGSEQVSLSVFLHGIGIAGDNVSPGTIGNVNPLHQQRVVTLDISNATNQTKSVQGTLTYNNTAKNFQGTVGIGNISTGLYTVRIRIPQYLNKIVPGIISIVGNQTTQIPQVSFTTGDINADNKLSILDYNMLLDCFSDLGAARNCSDANKKQLTDLNDDGTVNQFDYNLFLRELSVQSGQ